MHFLSRGRALTVAAGVLVTLIMGCRTNSSDGADTGPGSSDDATDYGTDDSTVVCTDPMPGSCEESGECGECGTCLMPGIIEIDRDGACRCRPDVGACLQGTQDQDTIYPYLMYHVEDGTVVWMFHKVAFEHPSWAYCSDGKGPPACSCDPDPFFDACG
jgi:hypothetical protein